MNMNEYQRSAVKTAVYPREPHEVGMYYCTMKLCGEAGEHAEKVAKFLRGDHDDKNKDEINAEKRKVVTELGDCLWYLANLADLYGYTLSEIAEMNLTKLADRADRGVLKGSGDNR